MKATGNKKKRSVLVFSIEDKQCIWMKAGVINYKLCDNGYDCQTCPFDKAMGKVAGEKARAGASWKDAMGGQGYHDRQCRHMLTGRAQYHLCSRGYRCNVCEYDQYLDEADLSTVAGVVHTQKASGFQVADNYYYHRGHSWARIEHGGFVRIGIDDFALKLLGRPTDILLPKLGSHLEQTEVGWAIKKGEKSAAMLSPMKGVVMATNQKVMREPDVLKKDPYGQGWLMVIEPQGLKQSLRSLLFENETVAWIKAEAQRLDSMVMSGYGMSLAATGGEIVDDVIGNLPHLEWEDVVHDFLLT